MTNKAHHVNHLIELSLIMWYVHCTYISFIQYFIRYKGITGHPHKHLSEDGGTYSFCFSFIVFCLAEVVLYSHTIAGQHTEIH